jgi:hypothetical protein
MDNGVIIAISGSTIAIVGVVIAMMFWCRQESNSVREAQKEDRKDILELIRAIDREMKDFHYRLIEIEKARSK